MPHPHFGQAVSDGSMQAAKAVFDASKKVY
jgi:hypothetical protein